MSKKKVARYFWTNVQQKNIQGRQKMLRASTRANPALLNIQFFADNLRRNISKKYNLHEVSMYNVSVAHALRPFIHIVQSQKFTLKS